MNIKRWIINIILFGSLLVVGCSDDAAGPETVNISGYWNFWRTLNGEEEGPAYMSIYQSKNAVTISETCTSHDPPIQGTIRGNRISFAWSEGQDIHHTASGNVTQTYMSGTWSNTAGESGTWRGEKRSKPECAWDGISVYASGQGAYEVWVGNESYRNEPEYWNYYYSISDYNFFQRGDAVSGGNTTISGMFKYYVVAVPDQACIDAIKLGLDTYLSAGIDWDWGNLIGSEENLFGEPDGACSVVGSGLGSSGGIYSGFILLVNDNYQAPEPSSIYQVWGGDFELNGTDGYHPEEHGYVYLGESSSTQTFNGSYLYYDIRVERDGLVLIDAVHGSFGQYYGTGLTGNTQRWERAGDAPDGKCALVGINDEGCYCGGYMIIAPQDFPESITVFVCNQ
jgi:hypothetical protein